MQARLLADASHPWEPRNAALLVFIKVLQHWLTWNNHKLGVLEALWNTLQQLSPSWDISEKSYLPSGTRCYFSSLCNSVPACQVFCQGVFFPPLQVGNCWACTEFERRASISPSHIATPFSLVQSRLGNLVNLQQRNSGFQLLCRHTKRDAKWRVHKSPKKIKTIVYIFTLDTGMHTECTVSICRCINILTKRWRDSTFNEVRDTAIKEVCAVSWYKCISGALKFNPKARQYMREISPCFRMKSTLHVVFLDLLVMP